MRASNSMTNPSKLAPFSLKGVAWISPQLRTSNEFHSFFVGGPTVQLREVASGDQCYPSLSIFLIFHPPTCEHHLPPLR